MKKTALLLGVLFIVSCSLNDSQSFDKNSSNWPGSYQGLLETDTEKNLVAVQLDGTEGILFARISLQNFTSEIIISDSIFWNAAGTGILLEDSEYKIELGDQQLIVVNGNERITLQKLDSMSSIEAKNWILEELNQVQLATRGKPIRILLNSSIQKLSGYDGCNYLNAAYQVYYPEKRIYLSPIASTRRACLESDSLARAFLNALNDFENYEIRDHQLALLKNGKVIARFKEEGKS